MTRRDPISSAEVKLANQRFFDLTSEVYEQADQRRDETLARYLDLQLREMSEATDSQRLLDVGCGAGFAAIQAARRFAEVVGIDISPRIAAKAAAVAPALSFMAADSDHLPFADACFDGLVALAVLHHLPAHEAFFAEAHRVLKPGGILYTDHDMSRSFRNVFRLPLMLYRLLRDEEKTYQSFCPQISHQLYDLTEIHREGLKTCELERAMRAAGFTEFEFRYHWLGLSATFDRLGRLINDQGRCPRGFAPSLSIWARKS